MYQPLLGCFSFSWASLTTVGTFVGRRSERGWDGDWSGGGGGVRGQRHRVDAPHLRCHHPCLFSWPRYRV